MENQQVELTQMEKIQERLTLTDQEISKFKNIRVDSLTGHNKELYEYFRAALISPRTLLENFRFEDLNY